MSVPATSGLQCLDRCPRCIEFCVLPPWLQGKLKPLLFLVIDYAHERTRVPAQVQTYMFQYACQEAVESQSMGTPLSDVLNSAVGMQSLLGLIILAQVSTSMLSVYIKFLKAGFIGIAPFNTKHQKQGGDCSHMRAAVSSNKEITMWQSNKTTIMLYMCQSTKTWVTVCCSVQRTNATG